jgi:sugar lactone lactonase YvrE
MSSKADYRTILTADLFEVRNVGSKVYGVDLAVGFRSALLGALPWSGNKGGSASATRPTDSPFSSVNKYEGISNMKFKSLTLTTDTLVDESITNKSSSRDRVFPHNIGLFIGIFVASAVSFPISATAAVLYAADFNSNSIIRFASDGTITTFATGVSSPNGGLAVDGSGNLFAGDYNAGIIYKYTSGGTKTTFATGLSNPTGLAFDGSGNLFASELGSGTIYQFTAGGTKTTFASGLTSPVGLAFDGSGSLFAADLGAGTVYKYTSGGARTDYLTGLSTPTGLAVDASGNLFIAQRTAGTILKREPSGLGNIFASGLNTPYGLVFDGSGNLYEADAGTSQINIFAPSGTKIGALGGLSFPTGLAIDSSTTGTPTAVPEPFTIIGTLIGGTAALRMRKKLRSAIRE